MDMKISTIYFKDEELFNAIDDLAHREKKSISELARLALADYIKVHGSGNPVYPLTNWTDNPQFVAIPALLADHRFIKSWLSSQKDEKIISEIKFKIQEWQHLLKEWDYGKL